MGLPGPAGVDGEKVQLQKDKEISRQITLCEIINPVYVLV